MDPAHPGYAAGNFGDSAGARVDHDGVVGTGLLRTAFPRSSTWQKPYPPGMVAVGRGSLRRLSSFNHDVRPADAYLRTIGRVSFTFVLFLKERDRIFAVATAYVLAALIAGVVLGRIG